MPLDGLFLALVNYVLVLILLLLVPLEWLFLALISMCLCSCLQGSASGGVGQNLSSVSIELSDVLISQNKVILSGL